MRRNQIPALAVRLSALAIVATLTVLAAPDGARAQDAVAAKAEIDKLIVELEEAYHSGDAASIAALYTEDAVLMPPNSEALTGRDAIQGLWTAALADGHQGDLSTKDVIVAGDYAIETGAYKIDMADGTHVDHGNYVVVWKKTPEGLRMARDIWNSNMAP
jgi:uncharacterized protein (TIGR02246 family)